MRHSRNSVLESCWLDSIKELLLIRQMDLGVVVEMIHLIYGTIGSSL